MTIGIYLLTFEGTDKVYVGQSVSIEKRYKEHLREIKDTKYGRTTDKLKDAYIQYGEPKLEILVICNSTELDTAEESFIEEFDSVNNGFNTLYKAGNPCMRGVDSPHAKYTKEVYISVFKELIKSDSTIKSISESLGVTKDLVQRMGSGHSHTWLKEEFPEEYRILEARANKFKHIVDGRLIRNTKTGETREVSNISKFCEDYPEFKRSSLSRMINGGRKSYLGWVILQL